MNEHGGTEHTELFSLCVLLILIFEHGDTERTELD